MSLGTSTSGTGQTAKATTTSKRACSRRTSRAPVQQRTDQHGSLQAPHRGDESQPQPVWEQPGSIQPPPIRCARQGRGWQGHRDRPADQLGQAKRERLWDRRRSHAAWESRAPARPRLVCERDRAWCHRAQKQPSQHRGRHPAVPVQPATGVQRMVLQHRPILLRGKR